MARVRRFSSVGIGYTTCRMTSRTSACRVALAMWIVRVALACFGLCCGVELSTSAVIADPIVLVVERPRAEEGGARPERLPCRRRAPRESHERASTPPVPDDVTYDVVLIPRRYQRFCALLC
jgi:hypothetical protein